MRVASEAHLSVHSALAASDSAARTAVADTTFADATLARAAAGRLLAAVLATLLLLTIWRPSLVRAQPAPAKAGAPAAGKPAAPAPGKATATTASSQSDTTTAAHVVRPGDTLWRLAERYYGDGHQWQELAKRNALATTTKGKVLLVGMKLRVPATLPAHAAKAVATKDADIPEIARTPAVAPPTTSPASTAPASAAAPAPSSSTVPVGGGSLAAQTAGKSDDVAPAPRTTGNKSGGKPSGSAKASAVASKGTATPARSSARIATSDAPAASPSNAATSPAASEAAKPAVVAAAEKPAADDLPPEGKSRRFLPSSTGESAASTKDGQLTPPTVHIGLVNRESLRDARKANEASTVFIRVVPEASELDAQVRETSISDPPRARRGEYEAAPFTIDAATISKAGRLVRRVGAVASVLSPAPQRLTIADALELTAPAGVTLSVGDRLVSLHLTDEVAKGVRIAVPSGVVLVTRVEKGKPMLGVVQTQAGSVEEGQSLLPVRGTAADPSLRATTIAVNDIETSVRWIDGTESLPTLHSYVLLGAGTSQGVKVGDEFELHTARASIKGKPVPNAGEERIARARVVRTGDKESTAVIVAQERAQIAVGIPARRVARIP